MALKTTLDRDAATLYMESLTHRLIQIVRRERVVLWRKIERSRIRIIRERVLEV